MVAVVVVREKKGKRERWGGMGGFGVAGKKKCGDWVFVWGMDEGRGIGLPSA